MKRIFITLTVFALVVACFCVSVGADFNAIEGDYPDSSPSVVSSLYDYYFTMGYYNDSTGKFTDWLILSSIETNLADFAFEANDVNVLLGNTSGHFAEFEIPYYEDDSQLYVVPYFELAENDPDITCVWSWKFADTFVLPSSLFLDRCPFAEVILPYDNTVSTDIYISYSYDYYDGNEWIHTSYLLDLNGHASTNVNLFPERAPAQSRLLRNLVTTIVCEDSVLTFPDEPESRYTVGVASYGVPYYIGDKTNNLNYTDAASYAIEQYGVIDGSRISFTNFLGNALGGVFDAPLFMIGEFEFTIGGLLGVCIGMGVLMLVLKKFAGG